MLQFPDLSVLLLMLDPVDPHLHEAWVQVVSALCSPAK
jgi:hypothetical protein